MQMFDLTLQWHSSSGAEQCTPIYGRYTLRTTTDHGDGAACGGDWTGCCAVIANIAIITLCRQVTVWRYLAAKFTDFKAGAVGQA